MVEEAQLRETEAGVMPAGEGWFVVNVRDARWGRNEAFGAQCAFEGPWPDAWFSQLGIKLSVLEPGKPNCLYHRESLQEDFLVLAGECLLLVEGLERPLRAWDFVHCPPDTEHVFVGAGDAPCVILMVGARADDDGLFFPVSELRAATGRASTARRPRATRRTPRQAFPAKSPDGPIPGRSFPGPRRPWRPARRRP